MLVNNAGICRDKMFTSMTETDWDDVMRVHLRGHFCLSSVLARVWRDAAKAGNPVDARIVNTSSGAGLQGSIGQSNYGAAKAGIAALTLMQAAELQRYGVRVNALAPAARTSMTEGVFADMMKKPEDGGFDYFDPANVAPLVVWLGSALSADDGGVRGRGRDDRGRGRLAYRPERRSRRALGSGRGRPGGGAAARRCASGAARTGAEKWIWRSPTNRR